MKIYVNKKLCPGFQIIFMTAFGEVTRQMRALRIAQAIRCVCVFPPIYLFIYSFIIFSLSYFTKRPIGWKILIYLTTGRNRVRTFYLPPNLNLTGSKTVDLNKILNAILATESFGRFKKWIKYSWMSFGFTKIARPHTKWLPSLLLKGPFKALHTYKAAERLPTHSDCTFWLILSV